MKKIKEVSKKIADMQTIVILSLIFFILVPIFSILVRSKKLTNKSFWFRWQIKSDSLEDMKRQY